MKGREMVWGAEAFLVRSSELRVARVRKSTVLTPYCAVPFRSFPCFVCIGGWMGGWSVGWAVGWTKNTGCRRGGTPRGRVHRCGGTREPKQGRDDQPQLDHRWRRGKLVALHVQKVFSYVPQSLTRSVDRLGGHVHIVALFEGMVCLMYHPPLPAVKDRFGARCNLVALFRK